MVQVTKGVCLCVHVCVNNTIVVPFIPTTREDNK